MSERCYLCRCDTNKANPIISKMTGWCRRCTDAKNIHEGHIPISKLKELIYKLEISKKHYDFIGEHTDYGHFIYLLNKLIKEAEGGVGTCGIKVDEFECLLEEFLKNLEGEICAEVVVEVWNRLALKYDRNDKIMELP